MSPKSIPQGAGSSGQVPRLRRAGKQQIDQLIDKTRNHIKIDSLPTPSEVKSTVKEIDAVLKDIKVHGYVLRRASLPTREPKVEAAAFSEVTALRMIHPSGPPPEINYSMKPVERSASIGTTAVRRTNLKPSEEWKRLGGVSIRRAV